MGPDFFRATVATRVEKIESGSQSPDCGHFAAWGSIFSMTMALEPPR